MHSEIYTKRGDESRLDTLRHGNRSPGGQHSTSIKNKRRVSATSYGSKVRGMFNTFHNQDFASYETPSTLQDTFSFMRTEKKPPAHGNAINSVPFMDRHQSESLRVKVDSVIHRQDHGLRVSMQSSTQSPGKGDDPGTPDITSFKYHGGPENFESFPSQQKRNIPQDTQQNNSNFKSESEKRRIKHRFNLQMKERANQLDEDTEPSSKAAEQLNNNTNGNVFRSVKIDELKSGNKQMPGVKVVDYEKLGNLKKQQSSIPYAHDSPAVIAEVTEDKSKSATEEMSLIISEFQNTQLLNSALTMTHSKQHESRMQNQQYQYSSSMLVSETSYYERQTQLQETKAVMNQLEAARQKQLEVYYSVSASEKDLITGESFKNSVKNSSILKKKDRSPARKIEKANDPKQPEQQKERMSLKELKQLIYPASELKESPRKEYKSSLERDDTLKTSQLATSQKKKKHNFQLKMSDFNIENQLHEFPGHQEENKPNLFGQRQQSFLDIGNHLADIRSPPGNFALNKPDQTPTLESKPYSSLQRTPEDAYDQIRGQTSQPDSKKSNRNDLKDWDLTPRRLISASTPRSHSSALRFDPASRKFIADLSSKHSRRECGDNCQHSPRLLQSLKNEIKNEQISPLMKPKRKKMNSKRDQIKSVSLPNFDMDISLKHSRAVCKDRCHHSPRVSMAKDDLEAQTPKSAQTPEEQHSLVAPKADPYVPAFAVDVDRKHSRKDCNDQCLHVPMIYQIRQEYPREKQQAPKERPKSQIQRANASPDRLSSANRQGEYTFNQELNRDNNNSRPLSNRHHQNFCHAQQPVFQNQYIDRVVRQRMTLPDGYLHQKAASSRSIRKDDFIPVARTTSRSPQPIHNQQQYFQTMQAQHAPQLQNKHQFFTSSLPPSSDYRMSPRLAQTQPLHHLSQLGHALSINTTSVFGQTHNSSVQADKYVQTSRIAGAEKSPKKQNKPPKPKKPSLKTDKRSKDKRIEQRKFEQKIIQYRDEKERLKLKPEINQRSKHLAIRGHLGIQELDELYGYQQQDGISIHGNQDNLNQYRLLETTDCYTNSQSQSHSGSNQKAQQMYNPIEKMCINIQFQKNKARSFCNLHQNNQEDQQTFQTAREVSEKQESQAEQQQHLRYSLPVGYGDKQKLHKKVNSRGQLEQFAGQFKHRQSVVIPGESSNNQFSPVKTTLNRKIQPQSTTNKMNRKHNFDPKVKSENTYLNQNYMKLKMDRENGHVNPNCDMGRGNGAGSLDQRQNLELQQQQIQNQMNQDRQTQYQQQQQQQQRGLWQRSALFKKTEMIQQMKAKKQQIQHIQQIQNSQSMQQMHQAQQMEQHQELNYQQIHGGQYTQRNSLVEQYTEQQRQNQAQKQQLWSQQAQKQMQIQQLEQIKRQKLQEMKDLREHQAQVREICLSKYLSEEAEARAQYQKRAGQCMSSKLSQSSYASQESTGNSTVRHKNQFQQHSNYTSKQNTIIQTQSAQMPQPSQQIYYHKHNTYAQQQQNQQLAKTVAYNKPQHSYSTNSNILIDDASKLPSGKLPSSMLAMRKSISGKIENYYQKKEIGATDPSLGQAQPHDPAPNQVPFQQTAQNQHYFRSFNSTAQPRPNMM